MSEEEKILIFAKHYIKDNEGVFEFSKKDLQILLNLIERQQKEIKKLKENNKDILRKLRNRVKEVHKLEKYSRYKQEFSRLNKCLEEKNKMIELMAEQFEIMKDGQEEIDCFIPREYSDIDDCVKKDSCQQCIIEYFRNKAKESE